MRLRLTLLALALGTAPIGAWAAERAADQVSGFAGSFSTGVPIQVPAFRGLEPRLSLGYSSEGRNGHVGVGWGLSGFSIIERTNPGGGTPKFDSTDIYMLDGQKLMACPGGSVSPSCTSGGTHATETESYHRILKTGSNTWEVTAPNGTKTVYTSLISFTPGTWRWGISSVTDTSNNVVNFSWTCNSGDTDCYPASISYGQYSVTIYRETRPDTRSFASYNQVRTSNYRIRSILVKVGSTNIRAYKLSYGISALTDRSLLTSVQMHGKDVVIDGNGAITGGTSLPPQTFAYTADAQGKSFVGQDTPPSPPGTTEAVSFTNLVVVTATGTGTTIEKTGSGFAWNAGASSTRAIDSGDGYVEFTNPGGHKFAIGLSNGDGDATASDIDFALVANYSAAAEAHENGVMKASTSIAAGDVFRIEISGGVLQYKRNGSAFYTSSKPIVYPLLVDTSVYSRPTAIGPVTLNGVLEDVAFWCNEVLMPADINGDGLADQVCFSSVGNGFVKVRLANATGFAQPQTWLSNRKFQSPMLSDFNADSRLDVADHDKFTGAVSVGLSNGTSFATPVSWGIAQGDGFTCSGNSNDTFNVSTGDFTGDGLTDVACRKFGTPKIFVGVSTGSVFTFSRWASLSCDANNYYTGGSSDFDGDGRDDYWCLNSSNDFSVWVSTGTGFDALAFGGVNAFSANPAFADLNGDGRTDLAAPKGKVALSTGKGFTVYGTTDNWCQYDQLAGGDVDGDGATELVCNKNGAGTNDILVRKWKAGALAAAETWKQTWCDGSVFGSDYNGDGKTDLLCNKQAATRGIAGTGGVQADLANSIVNSLGGTTQVSYAPGTSFYTPADNTPVVKQVVWQVTTLDGRGGSSARSYSFSGAYYNRPERRFMGFHYMKETLPCTAGETLCPYNETWLKQDLNSSGKPEEAHRRDGQGRLLTSRKFEYTTNGSTLPRTSYLTTEWTYIGDATLTTWPGSWPSALAKRTRAEHQYDAHGNRTQTISHGDNEVSGDETTTAWTYRPNSTAFITGAVARSQVFAGTSTLGSKLSETLSHYDGAGTWDQPPVKGLVTASLSWLDTENRYVGKTFSYDSYGNPTSATDETNRATTTAYDSTYHLLPISVMNNANESTTIIWDPVCRVFSSTTDLNNQVTTYQTDALCRPLRTDFPLGAFRQVTYLNVGNPATQAVKVETPSASPGDGTDNDYMTTYVDGLGRSYSSVKKGPSPSQAINQETTYNPRGAVLSRTAPYYTGDTKYWTQHEYDSFDRPKRTLLPDGNDTETTYGLLASTSLDPNNRPATARSDVFGRTLEKEAMLNGNPVVTNYSYDLLGRMTGIEDSVGNVWVYSFDSLGRNLAKNDPDAGAWSFEFDDAGRLDATVDAKSQRTEFSYDAAGRRSTKTSIGTPNLVTTFTYGEVRAGFYNLGQLTTVTSPADVLKTDYDAAGRPVKQVRTLDAVNYTAERRYDSAGRLLGITYPDGDAVGTPAAPLSYDSAGRLAGIPGIVQSVTYDAAGRPLVQTNANGSVTTRSYDLERGFLTGIGTTSSAGTIQNLAYTLDAAGLVEQVTSPFANESWSYSYDDLYRLTQATSTTNPTESQAWAYDEIGRITSNSRVGSYTYPAIGQPRPHAPLTAGSNNYSYDANGNMYAGAGRTITWTRDNLPSAVTMGPSTTSFTYGGAGERLRKQNGSNTSLYPFGDDYEVTGGVPTKYISAAGLRIVAKRVASTTYWLHTDRLGSIVATTDASGALAQRRSFRPYGETIASQTGHVESRGWIDQRNDSETGLTYLHSRYYDSTAGCFVSPDPLHPARPGVGSNRYAYAFGNPANLTDRSGLDTQIVCDKCRHQTRVNGGPWTDWYDCNCRIVNTTPDHQVSHGPNRAPGGSPGTNPGSGGGGQSPQGPNPIPSPEPTPQPAPTPEPAPTPAPEPEPEPDPDPEPAPPEPAAMPPSQAPPLMTPPGTCSPFPQRLRENRQLNRESVLGQVTGAVVEGALAAVDLYHGGSALVWAAQYGGGEVAVLAAGTGVATGVVGVFLAWQFGTEVGSGFEAAAHRASCR